MQALDSLAHQEDRAEASEALQLVVANTDVPRAAPPAGRNTTFDAHFADAWRRIGYLAAAPR